MSEDASRFKETLLVERVAEGLGLGKISKRVLGRRLYPPYLFLATLLVVDFGVVNTLIHLTVGEHIFATTPTAIAAIPGLVVAVVGIRYMSKGYAEAVSRLRIDDRSVDTELDVFERTFSQRIKVGVYLVGVVLLTAHVLFRMSPRILSFAGLPGLIHRVVVWNIYLLFVVEFTFLYIAVHVLVPRRLNEANLGLFYYDPENMGGFGSLGQLLKRSYYFYTVGLLLFLVISYGPTFLDPNAAPSDVPIAITGFFTLAWLLGVASIGHSMLTIHRLMADEKKQHIETLEEQLSDAIENPYEITTPEEVDEEEINDIERRLERVRATRVYPATFTMWSQIAISVLFPQALQIIIQSTG